MVGACWSLLGLGGYSGDHIGKLAPNQTLSLPDGGCSGTLCLFCPMRLEKQKGLQLHVWPTGKHVFADRQKGQCGNRVSAAFWGELPSFWTGGGEIQLGVCVLGQNPCNGNSEMTSDDAC